MPGTITSFSILEIVIPIGYFCFSVWAAYTSGYNMGMVRKQAATGLGQYGPYLGVIAAYVGIAAMLFLGIDAIGYLSGFLRLDIPAALSNLDFFDFFLKQFGSIHLFDTRYVAFIVAGLVFAAGVSYVITRIAYMRGKSHHIAPEPNA